MLLARILLAFALGSAVGCRTIYDDQQTRPLPPPEPPPERAAREAPPPRAVVTRPARPEPEPEPEPRPAQEKPTEASPSNALEPLQGSPSEPQPAERATAETPTSAPPSPPSDACLEQCRQTLASCVSAPSDVEHALEGCKNAFEACKLGC